MGKGFADLTDLLQNALSAAGSLGDKRSQALIKLHLGRLYYFGERRHDAMTTFSEGKAEVEELGDEDIFTRSAEFIGLYFFIQGLFAEAVGHFEKAVQSFETFKGNVIINPSAPIWLGYCAAYTGQFHRAIGSLDYYHRLSLQKGDRSLAATIRAVLGIVLLLAKKKQEAAYHLSGALQEAMRTKNALALYFSRGGLAYYHCLEGRLTETRELLIQAVTQGATAGLIRQYASPMVLEMLFELHTSGLPPLLEMSFQGEILRSLREPNIHLRGVALRLRAMDRSIRGDDTAEILADLQASEDHLMRAGTPVQLAKTRIEMVRLRLSKGEYEVARQLAQRAWMTVSGYGEGFYPDDLRHLLKVGNETSSGADSSEELVTRFVDIVQELVPSADLDRLLTRTVEVTNRYFGAERGGILWFSRRKRNQDPILRAACNLTPEDVGSEDFRPNMGLVRKAYQENLPQVTKLERAGHWTYCGKAILCLPFRAEGNTRGVLYHDNSYLDGCFDFLNKEQLVQMSRYLSTYLGQIREHCIRIEKQVSERSLPLEQHYIPELLTVSSAMERIVSQADQVAVSDSTVLLLGETGVGKEVLAHRIHGMSARQYHTGKPGRE
jgi:tetratricopeptide (TPR) repeat protein